LALAVWLAALGGSGAAAAISGVDEAVYYEIVYNTGANQASTIKRARVLDVLRIGEREFLVLESPSTNNPLKGFVSLEDVRSILPPGSFSSEH
jgi:hypothetical protein